jgi:hypothetical protein
MAVDSKRNVSGAFSRRDISELDFNLCHPCQIKCHSGDLLSYDSASSTNTHGQRLASCSKSSEPSKPGTTAVYRLPIKIRNNLREQAARDVSQHQENSRWSEFRVQVTRQLADIQESRHPKLSGIARFKEKVYSMGLCAAAIKIDYTNFPVGCLAFANAGGENVKCNEHGSNKCYCIWWYYKNDRVCMDWKPYALGYYEGMRRGDECELHESFKCYCLWRPSEKETENFCTYNLRWLRRRQR